MMDSEEKKIAFTRIIIEAMKSDGKVTVDEGEELYEEMTMDIKLKAIKMDNTEMISILSKVSPDSKSAIFSAIEQVLKSDGFIDPVEHIWFAKIMNKIN